MRRAAQWLLAGFGVGLMGVGLALLSGVMHPQGRTAATALVMMHPLPDAFSPGNRAGAGAAARDTGPGADDRVGGKEAPLGAMPQALEPPQRAVRRPGRERARPMPGPQARLAIVIDDIGHNVEATERFLGLGYPLTYSVLPDVAHARESAQLIHRAGREYIVHVPMEPFGYPEQNPGSFPLLLSLGMEETARRVRSYLETLPDATGASNHMGSAYTYDVDRMQVVQTVLAERELFFLNSKTSNTPVPAQVAHQWGYGYLERDVFLDHDLSEQAIAQAFRAVVQQARRAGRAIAIGHPHPQTWRVLQRGLPRLAAEGVRLVTLSELRGRSHEAQ